jgi:hypothetical protein
MAQWPHHIEVARSQNSGANRDPVYCFVKPGSSGLKLRVRRPHPQIVSRLRLEVEDL